MITLVPVIIGTIIFLKLNKFYQFTIFCIAALLPFSFGNFMSIPDLLIVEWLTIVVFLMLMNELVPLNSVEKKIGWIKFKGIEIFIFAILILITWTIVSYVNNEMVVRTYKEIDDKRGIFRLYFTIFNNVILFFTTLIFVAAYFEKIDFYRFFKVLLMLAVSLGILRIFSYFFSFSMPFLAGTFGYDPNAMRDYGGTAYRFGGLSEIAVLGVPALFANYVLRQKMNLLLLILLLVFVFLSGGRTIMVGVFLSIIIFSFLFLPKNFIYLITAGGLLFILLTIIAPEAVLTGQFSRLTTFDSGNFMGQDAWRALAWQLFLKNFYANPIWGKGIGISKDFFYSSFEGATEFAKQMLFTGGHGSYLSLLSTFGLGGISYFLIMIFGGIYLSYRKIQQHIRNDSFRTAIAVFCFMLLIIKAVDFITGGDGLSEATIIFFIVGFICSLTVLQNRKI